MGDRGPEGDEVRPHFKRLVASVMQAAAAALVVLGVAVGPAQATTSVPTHPGPTLSTPELVAATPGSELRGIGSDGADGVWFSPDTADHKTAYLSHYRPTQPGLTSTGFAVTSPFSEVSDGIAPGLGGTEWFTRYGDNQISEIHKDGALSTKTLKKDRGPLGIEVDPQGNVWFAARQSAGCAVGRVSAGGTLTEFPAQGGTCYDLTVGPDGNIWVANYDGSILELSASTGERLASYPARLPVGIATLGQDVYVSETEPGVIVQIAPSGELTEYVLPDHRSLEWLTAGPDGAVWFIENEGPAGTPAIGRLTPSGALSEVTVPGNGGPAFIAATNDAIYFTYDTPETGFQPGVMRIPLSNIATPEEASYVALGDSYSSGEGNPPYEVGSTPPPNPDPGNPDAYNTCHRSQAAYGPLIDGARTLGPMIFKACSGAVTEDFFNENPNNAPEPAQLSWLRPTDKTVTLTVGGNDAGFVHVVSKCVEGPRGSVPFYQPFGCSKDNGLRAETDLRLKALEGSALAFTPPPEHRPIRTLTEVIKAVRSHAANARIVVGGYPHLFGPTEDTYEPGASPSGKVCRVGTAQVPSVGPVPLLVDYRDALWLNKLAGQLDAAIRRSVTAAQAEGIPVSYVAPKLSVHGLCASGEPWLNAVELDGANEVEPGSFHPTATGQRLAYEPAFATLLK